MQGPAGQAAPAAAAGVSSQGADDVVECGTRPRRRSGAAHRAALYISRLVSQWHGRGPCIVGCSRIPLCLAEGMRRGLAAALVGRAAKVHRHAIKHGALKANLGGGTCGQLRGAKTKDDERGRAGKEMTRQLMGTQASCSMMHGQAAENRRGPHSWHRPPPAGGCTRLAARAARCRRPPAPQTLGCERGWRHSRCGTTLAHSPRLRCLGKGGRAAQKAPICGSRVVGARWHGLSIVQPSVEMLHRFACHSGSPAAAAHPAACTAGRRSTRWRRCTRRPPRRAPHPLLLSSLQVRPGRGGGGSCRLRLSGGRRVRAPYSCTISSPRCGGSALRCPHCSTPRTLSSHLGAPLHRSPAAWLGIATARPRRCCWSAPPPTRRQRRL